MDTSLIGTHKLYNYTPGDTILCFRPATPDIQQDGILGDLSVKGSYEYRWNTDCLSIDKIDSKINIKYHTWHHRDKYDEGLENTFSINIENVITIEYEDPNNFPREKKQLIIPLEWLYADTLQSIPEVLTHLVFTDFTYAHMDLGKTIYLVLCQIYKHKKDLDM